LSRHRTRRGASHGSCDLCFCGLQRREIREEQGRNRYKQNATTGQDLAHNQLTFE
jgi:hypothetical protein